MREVFKNNHGSFWISALEAKYEGKGKEFGREDFDKFLGDYSASSDALMTIEGLHLPTIGSQRYPGCTVCGRTYQSLS